MLTLLTLHSIYYEQPQQLINTTGLCSYIMQLKNNVKLQMLTPTKEHFNRNTESNNDIETGRCA